MGLLDWLKPESEQGRYQTVMEEVFLPLRQRLEALPEREFIPILSSIADASEKAFGCVLFSAPPMIKLKKKITADEAGAWLKTAAAGMLGYGAEFDDSYSPLLGGASEVFWDRAVGIYSREYKQAITLNHVRAYSAALREDNSKQYSRKGDLAKAMHGTWIDNFAIGRELLNSVWHTQVKESVPQSLVDPAEFQSYSLEFREALFVGSTIWRAYSQLVLPVLIELVAPSR